MRHGGHAPEQHRQSISHSRSHAIDESPYHQHANSVSRLKHKHQITVIDFVPSEIVLQRCFQDAQNLPIHVVLADSDEKHRADDPAELALRKRPCDRIAAPAKVPSLVVSSDILEWFSAMDKIIRAFFVGDAWLLLKEIQLSGTSRICVVTDSRRWPEDLRPPAPSCQ